MGRAESTAAAGGTFRPVGFEQPAEPERRVRTDDEIDFQNLSEEEQEVVTSDTFVIYGKANIEQWNDPGPGEDHLYIEMDALENSLDQLFALENISFGHQDVRVGEPLESHTLETDATVHLDSGETLQFDAGDELRTQVIREGEGLPGDNGTADEDALWLAANVFGREDPRGSRFSQKVRLGAYYGDLDGFSVTVDKLEMTPTEQGVRTHEVDFLAVTIGNDEDIKNPGSSFGVAEFQARFRDRLGLRTGRQATSCEAPDGAEGVAQGAALADSNVTLEQQLMGSLMQSLLGSSKDALASEAIQQAYDDDSTDLETAAEQVAGDEADAVYQQAEQKVDDLEDGVADIVQNQDGDGDADADDIEDAAADLADALGMDKEFVMDMVDEARKMQDEVEDGDGDGNGDGAGDGSGGQQGDYEDDEDDEDEEMQARIDDLEAQLDSLREQIPDGEVATQSAIEDALEGVATTDEIESQLDDLGESISDDIGGFIEEQMETGATPGPTGGGVNEQDVGDAMETLGEKYGLEVTNE